MSRAWCVLILVLAGCDTEPPPSVRPDVEAIHMETAQIRKAVDAFKADPTNERRTHVNNAFAELDQQIEELRQDAEQQTGEERVSTEQWIADLKHRRDLQWTRFQAAPTSVVVRTAQGVPVRRAQRVKPGISEE